MAKVFISHSSKDKEFVRALCEALHDVGHEPWFDEWEVRVGECIVTRVEHGIEEADFVALVLSPHAVTSGWVDREWKAKYWGEIETRKTAVLPVLIADCDIPLLLRTKRYADFRRQFTTGFVQLMAAISPTLARPRGANRLTVNAGATRAASLLAHIQDSATPLGATVAEILALALELRDASLEHLCRGELGGWSPEVIEKRPNEKPIHRQIELFASLDSQVNTQFFGWGENVANVFNYMRVNPDTWTAVRMHVPNSIAELEDLAARPVDLKRGLMSFTLRLGSLLADAKNPESPVFAYARPDSYIKALAATRAEFTKRLLQLLPKAEPA